MAKKLDNNRTSDIIGLAFKWGIKIKARQNNIQVMMTYKRLHCSIKRRFAITWANLGLFLFIFIPFTVQ